MNFDFKTERKENSQMLLTITFPKDEIKIKYEERLKEIKKEIIIKGFRKGKAPISLIETKYKDIILEELSVDLIDMSFKDIYDKLEKKPLTVPITNIKDYKKIELDKDYSVELIYDVYPDFEYEDYHNIEIEKDEVIISKKDIENRINEYLNELATIETKDGAIENKDIAYINYTVKKNNKEIEKKEGTHIWIDINNNNNDNDIIYTIYNEIIGLKKGDKKVIKIKDKDSKNNKNNKKNDVTNEDLTKKEIPKTEIEIEILEVKKRILPELTDEVIKELNKECSTVKEFYDKVEKELRDYAEKYLRDKNINKILESLSQTYKGDIPESIIKSNLETYKKSTNFTNEEEARKKVISKIKTSFIINDLLKKENISIDEEEFKNSIIRFNKYNIPNESFLKILKKSNQFEKIQNEAINEIIIDKLYNKIWTNLKIKKGKKIKFEELFEKNLIDS